MKVFGWVADYQGCGYYRVGLPLWALNNCAGVMTVAHPTLHDSVKRGADIIVGQRICKTGVTKTWQEMCDKRLNTVFEIDDDLYNIPPSNAEAHEYFVQNPEMGKNLHANAAAAKAVTVTNQHLADLMGKDNPNVHILPNCIDGALLMAERPVNDKVTVGWAGSATHHGDFKIVAPHLRRFFRNNPDVDMHFIGHSYADSVKKDARHTPWTIEISDYYKTIDFDIGIAPLANDIFNRSKSYIKALEYAALGIPVIASDVEPYRNFVKHGETGFLVNHSWEWSHYLNLLVQDEPLRRKLGEAAKEVAADYTIQKNVIKWYKLYESLIES